MIEREVLESKMFSYSKLCTVREVLSRPDYKIIRDIRKASKLFPVQAAESEVLS